MQLLSFVPALFAVALAAPAPEESTLRAIQETEKLKRDYALLKRDNSGCGVCEVQPTTPNYLSIDVTTDTSFLADANLAAAANNAPTPAGYTKVYTNLKASSNGYVYMGNDVLKTAANVYNPAECAAKCDSIAGCLSFNIFVERDPTVDACSSTCQDPPAFANVKCTYWGGALTTGSAVNDGQWRNQFHLVIGGSNAYASTKVPTTPEFDTVEVLGGASINAPLDCAGNDTYLGFKLFQNTPFDIRLCADACTAQTAYNVAHPPATGEPKYCNFWNTYLLDKNGVSEGQYCSLYTQAWNATYATNVGQWRGNDHYTISSSFTGFDSSTPGYPDCEDDTSCPNF